MSDKKTSRKKVVDKPVEPVEQVINQAPQTHHTVRDICKSGTAYKSAVADLKYIRQRASIERATDQKVKEAEYRANHLYNKAKQMHAEYQKQNESQHNKNFAKDHMAALNRVR